MRWLSRQGAGLLFRLGIFWLGCGVIAAFLVVSASLLAWYNVPTDVIATDGAIAGRIYRVFLSVIPAVLAVAPLMEWWFITWARLCGVYKFIERGQS